MRTPGGIRLYDLNSQIEHLKTRYSDHERIEDVGSGLNFKRKGFNALLELIATCGANVDRDLNGARGIFLRALAVTP